MTGYQEDENPTWGQNAEAVSGSSINSAECHHRIKWNSSHQESRVSLAASLNSSGGRLIAECQLEAAGLITTVHADLLDGTQAEAFQVIILAQRERQCFQFITLASHGNLNMLFKPRPEWGELGLHLATCSLEEAEEAPDTFAGMPLVHEQLAEIKNRIRLARQHWSKGAENVVDLFVRMLHARKET